MTGGVRDESFVMAVCKVCQKLIATPTSIECNGGLEC